jgi:hypothetical protein
MDERTGGQHVDTGSGPKPLDPEPEPAVEDSAWTTYIRHREGCVQCRRHILRCAEGNDLWNGYTARH